MDFKKEYDTIVIGAGPSGVKAALKCSKKGQKVLIIDSNQNSGGQIYRAPPKSYVKKDNNSLEENLIQIKFSEHYHTTNDKEKDFKHFHAFFKGVKGSHSELS